MKKKVSVPFFKTDVDVIIVKYSLLDGTESNMIVDTGSEWTLFTKDFSLAHKKLFTFEKTEEEVNVISMHTSKAITLVKGITTVMLNGAPVQISGMIDKLNLPSHTPVTAILGNDMLRKYNAKIDYNTKTINLYL